MDLVIPNRSLTIQAGAVDPWTKPQHSWYMEEFRLATKGKVRLGVPIYELRADERALLHEHIRRVLPPGRGQEIQGARARFSEPLSRLHAVS